MNITPCTECETWCTFEDMKIIGHELYCDDCFEEFVEVFEVESE